MPEVPEANYAIWFVVLWVCRELYGIVKYFYHKKQEASASQIVNLTSSIQKLDNTMQDMQGLLETQTLLVKSNAEKIAKAEEKAEILNEKFGKMQIDIATLQAKI